MKPSRLLLGLLGGLFAAAVLLGALPLLGIRLADSLMPLAWGLLLALLLMAAVDALWLRRQDSPRLERVLPGNLPLGRWSEVQLIAHHDFAQPQEIEVFDHVPEGMAFDFLPQRITLQPGRPGACCRWLAKAASTRTSPASTARNSRPSTTG